MHPDGPGRWCEEHERLECTRSRKKGRGPCHGSAVTGSDRCRMHLGEKAAPVIAEAAARKAVETYGLPRDISPTDALLEEVRYSAGHVAWLRAKVAELEPGSLVWGKTEEVDRGASEFTGIDTTHAAAVNMWLDLYHRERRHLLDLVKTAISVGIEERRVRLEEAKGQVVAELIKRILSRLDLSDVQRDLAVTVIPEEFRRIIGAELGLN
jgi:hypothetical protein